MKWLEKIKPYVTKVSEFFQQQDGALCALQLSVVIANLAFWGTWVYLSVLHGVFIEPTVVAGALTASLGLKIWKDVNDNKTNPPTT